MSSVLLLSSSSSETLLPRLPAELIDYTIDFLHDDTPSLRALALTSHTTLPAARFHIFHSASLHSDADLSKFTSLVTTKPHLTPYIRALSLSKATTASPSSRVSTIDTSSAWETTLADSLPVYLPSLRSLHLNHFLSFWQPASFSVLSFNAFAAIQTLHVSDSSLRSFTELRLLLTSLPDIRTLVLEGVGIGVKGEDLSWLLASREGDKDGDTQILDGTSTPPHYRARARSQSLSLSDPLALTSLHISHQSNSSEPFTPTLSLDALSVLLNYLLTTPTLLSLKVQNLKFDGFEKEEEHVAVIKSFKDALVKATKERVDYH